MAGHLISELRSVTEVWCHTILGLRWIWISMDKSMDISMDISMCGYQT